MQHSTPSIDWRHVLWLAILVTASVLFTGGFACAVPFAAFAASAALTLPGKNAYILVIAVWLANQAVGYAFLGYPQTLDSFIWGGVFCITALVSTFAARIAAQSFHGFIRAPLAFLAAFFAYEAILYSASTILGGTETYTLATQGRIFVINAGAVIGLMLLNKLGTALRLAPTYSLARA